MMREFSINGTALEMPCLYFKDRSLMFREDRIRTDHAPPSLNKVGQTLYEMYEKTKRNLKDISL